MPSRSYLFAINCLLPAQPVGVPCSCCGSSSRSDFSADFGREIRPEIPLVRQHCPHDARRFVGLRYASDIHVSSCGQLRQPIAATFRLAHCVSQHRPGAMHQQPAHISVAALADALQVFLAATGMLLRHQTKESRQLPSILEGADAVAHRGFEGPRRNRSNPRPLFQPAAHGRLPR